MFITLNLSWGLNRHFWWEFICIPRFRTWNIKIFLKLNPEYEAVTQRRCECIKSFISHSPEFYCFFLLILLCNNSCRFYATFYRLGKWGSWTFYIAYTVRLTSSGLGAISLYWRCILFFFFFNRLDNNLLRTSPLQLHSLWVIFSLVDLVSSPGKQLGAEEQRTAGWDP